MKFLLLLLFIILNSLCLHSQEIYGDLLNKQGQVISIYTYDGINSKLFSKNTIDSKGEFKLEIPSNYNGMGSIITEDKTTINLILNNQPIELTSLNNEIIVKDNSENINYTSYLTNNRKRSELNSAWKYLLNQYKGGQIKSKNQQKFIQKEIARLNKEDKNELNNFDYNSYAKYIIKLQNLINSTSLILKEEPNSIDSIINVYRELNYNDDRIYHSGLLKNLLETQYFAIENSGKQTDSVYIEMNKNTDCILASLENNEKKFNEITNFIFDLLEKHSLFQASEYLALKVLNQNSCQLDNKLESQLEYYRKMKVGNIAPDLILEGGTLKNGIQLSNSINIKQLESDYKLIVFGASWCPKCVEEIQLITKYYNNWQMKNVEVIFISLDSDIEAFVNFTKLNPWISSSTLKGWDSKSAKDYNIHSTPTLLMLDKSNKIIVKPISVLHANSWIDYYL